MVRVRVVIGMAIVIVTRVAAADAPRPVAIASAAGTCPSSTDVTAALIAIFPDLQSAAADDATALHIELSATEHGMHVRAGNAERDFTGDDCAERARKAAVFVALVLAPPTVDAPVASAAEPSAPAVVTRAAVGAPPHAERAWPWLQVDAAAAIETAPRDANDLYASGGELGVFVGAEHVGAIASVAALAASDMQVGSTVASLSRTPVALGVRVRTRDGRIGLAADAAVTTSLLVVRGLGMYGAESDRFELGARAGARIEFWVVPGIAVFAAAQLDVVPDTYNLALPSGMAGTTPGWWLGGVIGATAGFP
ncbi:MAG TPA: hypothetical protein VH143_27670 [Kofleriaceae bacterium]|nr:hypothetical protein [Kofleriaceae bacterium]